MSPPQIFIARQPILDTDMQRFAYALRFFHEVFPNVERLETTEALIKETEDKVGLEKIVGKNAMILALPTLLIRPKASRMIIEVSKEVAHSKEVLQNIKTLRQEHIKEVLIKSLEILRDFKGAKPNSRPLRYPFLPYRHTPAKRCLDAGNLACPESKRLNQHFLKLTKANQKEANHDNYEYAIN